MIMAENEEQGREIRNLKRKNEELNNCVKSLKEENKGDCYKRDKSHPLKPMGDILLLGSSDEEEQFAKMSDLNDKIMKTETNTKSTTTTADEKIPQTTQSVECYQVVKSSRAKLKTSNQCSSPPIASPDTPPA